MDADLVIVLDKDDEEVHYFFVCLFVGWLVCLALPVNIMTLNMSSLFS